MNKEELKIRLHRASGLRRFLRAQDRKVRGTGLTAYELAMRELRDGRKHSHWMWFVFPQGVRDGRYSYNTRVFALTEEEAVRYLRHPVLGARLRWAIKIVTIQVRDGVSLRTLFGPLDARKFLSCLDLFAKVAPLEFAEVRQRLTVAVLVHERVNRQRAEERKD